MGIRPAPAGLITFFVPIPRHGYGGEDRSLFRSRGRVRRLGLGFDLGPPRRGSRKLLARMDRDHDVILGLALGCGFLPFVEFDPGLLSQLLGLGVVRPVEGLPRLD